LLERERFYRGLVVSGSSRKKTIWFDVAQRKVTRKWSSAKLLGLAMDSIVSFSTIPMHLMTRSLELDLVLLHRTWRAHSCQGWQAMPYWICYGHPVADPCWINL
jgi:hypothetical protein